MYDCMRFYINQYRTRYNQVIINLFSNFLGLYRLDNYTKLMCIKFINKFDAYRGVKTALQIKEKKRCYLTLYKITKII